MTLSFDLVQLRIDSIARNVWVFPRNLMFFAKYVQNVDRISE